jgi:hypothetical protein
MLVTEGRKKEEGRGKKAEGRREKASEGRRQRFEVRGSREVRQRAMYGI